MAAAKILFHVLNGGRRNIPPIARQLPPIRLHLPQIGRDSPNTAKSILRPSVMSLAQYIYLSRPRRFSTGTLPQKLQKKPKNLAADLKIKRNKAANQVIQLKRNWIDVVEAERNKAVDLAKKQILEVELKRAEMDLNNPFDDSFGNSGTGTSGGGTSGTGTSGGGTSGTGTSGGGTSDTDTGTSGGTSDTGTSGGTSDTGTSVNSSGAKGN